MSDDLFKGRYRIPSARAKWHGYDHGVHFVTICTHGMEQYFGEIVKKNGPARQTMVLSLIGIYANTQLRHVHDHYHYAKIPTWVVMPNHIHCIVIIDHNKIPFEKRNVYNATTAAPTTHDTTTVQTTQPIQTATQMQTWLAVVIRGLKSSVTRYANKNNIPFAWQTRFHDHIIRDPATMERCIEYIRFNVANWRGL